jgi:hypothetical protein
MFVLAREASLEMPRLGQRDELPLLRTIFVGDGNIRRRRRDGCGVGAFGKATGGRAVGRGMNRVTMVNSVEVFIARPPKLMRR